MSIELDPTFRETASAARRRRRSKRLRRGGIAAALLLCLVLSGWLTLTPGALPQEQASIAGDPDTDLPEDGFVAVQTEDSASAAPPRRIALRSPDAQADPMLLHLPKEAGNAIATLAGPDSEAFNPARVGFPAPDRFSLFKTELKATQQRVQVVLPSSSADFALFHQQRSEGLAAMRAEQDRAHDATAPVESGTRVSISEDSSWGSFIADAEDTAASGEASYVETRIENTTSTAIAIREEQRAALYRDDILAVNHERKLGDLLTDTGLDAEAAAHLAQQAVAILGAPDTLSDGAVVAVRTRDAPEGRSVLQISLYAASGYIGTLARTGFAHFESGADPWYSENLLNHAGRMRQEQQDNQDDVRLIDAIYSAGLSQGLPSRMVGELIVTLSKAFDLDRFAAPGDRLTVLFASQPGSEGQGVGQIVFAGLKGPSGTMPCYVVPLTGGGFGCAGFGGAGDGGSSAGGFVVPVDGVKTSGFGPRHHPILKQVRNHNGVDWAAPTGTPVRAAMAGTINFAGDGRGYGNVVYIDHPGGVQTRYAHLNAFAPGLRAGQAVAAGQVIGEVGTTGRSTGPHLHFELHVAGQPLDPLTWRGTVVASVSDGGAPGSEAVEALVNRIIKVESGGNARAKNPLSSATGLGQFINSTWLRMIRDYRPDLANSMPQAEILALRFDPALSREMVRNLARENEAFLRAHGRPIRPGTLYLAHFLGPAGAVTALGADPSASVLSVMGSSVVNANPFLGPMTIADMIAWSDRKMTGKSSVIVVTNKPSSPPPISAEVKAFREAVDEALKGM